MTSAPALPAASPAAEATKIPPKPRVPSSILELADKPLFTANYSTTETKSWREGLPVFGKKVSSSRNAAFTNDFNILRTNSPMIDYAAATYSDALRSARDVAFNWSDPAFGGKIYSSVGVAVLQAAEGSYFLALVGSGKPQTSTSELGYRNDRFDNNILGSPRKADSIQATSTWSQPVDKNGSPVDAERPSDSLPVNKRKLDGITLAQIAASTPMLKTIVDVRDVFDVA